MMVFLGCYRFFESVILQTLSVVHKVSFLRDTESKMICRVGGSVMALEKHVCVGPLAFPAGERRGIAGRGSSKSMSP